MNTVSYKEHPLTYDQARKDINEFLAGANVNLEKREIIGVFGFTKDKRVVWRLNDRDIKSDDIGHQPLAVRAHFYQQVLFYHSLTNVSIKRHEDPIFGENTKIEIDVLPGGIGATDVYRGSEDFFGLGEHDIPDDMKKASGVFKNFLAQQTYLTVKLLTEAYPAYLDEEIFVADKIFPHIGYSSSRDFLDKNKHLDSAMFNTDNIEHRNKGGIDFNPAQMAIETKKEGQDFSFNFNGQEIDAAQVVGATFEIQQMTPVTNLPVILGLSKANPT